MASGTHHFHMTSSIGLEMKTWLPMPSQGQCHRGLQWMAHYVRFRNIPYSIEEIKCVTSQCPECTAIKPRFYQPPRVDKGYTTIQEHKYRFQRTFSIKLQKQIYSSGRILDVPVRT